MRCLVVFVICFGLTLTGSRSLASEAEELQQFEQKGGSISIAGKEIVKGFERGLPLAVKIWKAARPLQSALEHRNRALNILSGSNDHLKVKPFIDDAERMAREIKALPLPQSKTSALELQLELQHKLDFANEVNRAFGEVIEDLQQLSKVLPRASSYTIVEQLWVEEFPAARRALNGVRSEIRWKLQALDRIVKAHDLAGDTEEEGPFQLIDFYEEADRVDQRILEIGELELPTDAAELAAFEREYAEAAEQLKRDVKAVVAFANRLNAEGDGLPATETYLKRKYADTAEAAGHYAYRKVVLHARIVQLLQKVRGVDASQPTTPESTSTPSPAAPIPDQGRVWEQSLRDRDRRRALERASVEATQAELEGRNALRDERDERQSASVYARDTALSEHAEQNRQELAEMGAALAASQHDQEARDLADLERGSERSRARVGTMLEQDAEQYDSRSKGFQSGLKKESDAALAEGIKYGTSAARSDTTVGALRKKDGPSPQSGASKPAPDKEAPSTHAGESTTPTATAPGRSKGGSAQTPARPHERSVPDMTPRLQQEQESEFGSEVSLGPSDRFVEIRSQNATKQDTSDAIHEFTKNDDEVFWDIVKKGTWHRFKKWFEGDK